MGTIAAVAPLVGLLGTVVGMIDVSGPSSRRRWPYPATSQVVLDGTIDDSGGLVAIPTFIGYRFQLSRVDHIALEMEEVLPRSGLAGAVFRDEGAGDWGT